MTIDEVYKRVKALAAKSGYLSYISPDDFNSSYRASELKYFNKLYDRYAQTQRIDDSLSPFLTDPIPATLNPNGQYASPANLLHVSAARTSTGGEIDRVEQDRLGNHLKSTYDNPTEEFPIYTEYSAYVQFYPINIQTPIITYLKRPVAAKWGYTLVSGRPVYSSGTSVQPLWKDNDMDNIIYLILQDMGIQSRDAELENFAQLQAKTQS